MTAARPKCPECKIELNAHCPRNADCPWWKCINHRCPWTIYSFRRRLRVHKDSHVESFEVAT